MKKLKFQYKLPLSFLFTIFIILFAASVFADPPTRVARLSTMEGAVTFAPAGEDKWAYATHNRPFTTGDQLWADTNARAELQLGTAAVRIGANTSLTIVNLDDTTAQFQLTQGTINLRIWKINSGQVYEVDTPNLAFTVTKAGNYRIDVDVNGNATMVTVRDGSGIAEGDNASDVIEAPQACKFMGTNLTNPQCSSPNVADDFDNWCSQRDTLIENSTSARNVAPGVIGHEDLDNNGTWGTVGNYGNAWTPTNVAADWTPYQDGEWVWINPWGWTWVDEQPWGFAPYHYGRWTYYEDRWYWVPGPVIVEPVYAPALVVFVGGGGYDIDGIAWFPLGPEEPYIPPYWYSPKYLARINHSNTIINDKLLRNLAKNPNMNWVFKNRTVANAITAVPKDAFINSTLVNKSLLKLPKDVLAKAPLTRIAAVTPAAKSIIGNAKSADIKPPTTALNRTVIAKIKPPVAPVPFAEQQAQLAKDPGKPLPTETLTSLKPGVSKANIAIVKPSSVAPNTLKANATGKIQKTMPTTVPQPPGAKSTSNNLIPNEDVPHEGIRNKVAPSSTVPHPPAMTREPKIIHPHQGRPTETQPPTVLPVPKQVPSKSKAPRERPTENLTPVKKYPEVIRPGNKRLTEKQAQARIPDETDADENDLNLRHVPEKQPAFNMPAERPQFTPHNEDMAERRLPEENRPEMERRGRR